MINLLPIDNARSFVDALAASGQFTRNARSQVLFEMPTDVGPRDYIVVSRAGTLASILVEHGADEKVLDAHKLWTWLGENIWRLPRTGGKPTVRK